jgi:hypothetical protein
MTNKDVYIGDSVYFLEETDHNGEFPRILRGVVQMIRPDSIQVKVTFNQYTNDLWVDLAYCHKTAQDLVKALYIHLMQEAYIVDNPDKEPR